MTNTDLGVNSFYLIGCMLAVAAGTFLATQSGVNSTLGIITGRSFAAVVSFAVGLVALVVFCLVDIYGLGNKGPDLQSIKAVPWWAWTGGLLGAWYVAVVIIFVRTLGAATLMAIFVTAQLSTAVTLDTLGWVGFRRRPLHWARIVGLLLMIAGVSLVSYFDGTHGRSSRSAGTTAPGPHAHVGGAATPEVPGKTGIDDGAPLLSKNVVSDDFGKDVRPGQGATERHVSAGGEGLSSRRLSGGGRSVGQGDSNGGDVELLLGSQAWGLSALPNG